MRLLISAFAAALLFPSCADREEERKPVPPPSNSRQTSWSTPKPGQGGGAFGALPQQPRR